MKLSIGIVGLPNVGKSTLFSVLTKKQVDVANYPFCTIDPNVGVVEVPDERVQKLSLFFHSAKTIPAIVEFVDIAGLVRGANKGEGLGNQFLANIREVDAICQVLRVFQDKDIIHVENSVDPVRDMDTVLTELELKDLETVEKRLESVAKEVKAQKKGAVQEESSLLSVKEFLSQGKLALDYIAQHPKEGELLAGLQLLTAKPILYLINGNENQIPERLLEKLNSQNGHSIVMNVKDEVELAQLSPEEAQDLGMTSCIPLLIQRAYETLGLITFFTTGVDETRAWTIKQGMLAPQAGGAIHSDFEQKFIRAEVISWDKLLEVGGYAKAQSKGLVRTEGKEYVVQDGDVIEIMHG